MAGIYSQVSQPDLTAACYVSYQVTKHYIAAKLKSMPSKEKCSCSPVGVNAESEFTFFRAWKMRFESLGPGILFWLQSKGCEIIRLNDKLGNGKKKYLKGSFIKMLQTGAPRGLTLFQRFRKVTHRSYKVCERGGMFQMKVNDLKGVPFLPPSDLSSLV